MINPIDEEDLRRQVISATPFQHCAIDNFLDAGFAERVHDSFPTFAEARRVGREFNTVNEKKKIQIIDAAIFPAPLLELNRLLASPELLGILSRAFDIPNLLADDQLLGGGIHQTGPRGRLDVHVDFNYIADRQLHRRLNILIYFNKNWKAEWGGNLELWDKDVKRRHHSFAPDFNRCLVFETSDASYHGVSAVNCPEDRDRRSFAAYYYTKEPPGYWEGAAHSTIFRSRPDEVIKGAVLMPFERAERRVREALWRSARGVKRMIRGKKPAVD